MSQPPDRSDFARPRTRARVLGGTVEHARDDQGSGAFRRLEVAVRSRMLAGAGLTRVEDEVIDPATVSSDKKAVLWLLAWSMLPSSYQLAEVQAHIELLSLSD
jgi:hypothetical protein